MPNDIIDENLEQLSGIVERITYKNEQNGYTVAKVKVGKENIVVVGIMPFLNNGESADFYGRYVVHASYGRQFECHSFERKAPSTAASILKYLSSGVIKGVGPATATKIVEKFGSESLNVIQNSPQDLALIKSISIDKAMAISEEYKKQYGVRDVMMLLSAYDVSTEKSIAIFKKFGDKSVDIIKDNPYSLCCEEIDFSFEKVEKIAYDFGISPDNEMRLIAGVEYILRKNLSNGHTCLPRHKLSSVAISLLESDEYRIDSIFDKMIERFIIRCKRIDEVDYLSLPAYFSAEEYIAARMLAIKANIKSDLPIDDLEIEYVENKIGIRFEDTQRLAIKSAFNNGVLILTGGPGTGKTTTLNAIIELFERRDSDIVLAAPTGRAAKRMTELTGRTAKTIHRLLEAELTSYGKHNFSRNERNQLECDVIIVDEASMIDSLLFESLLKALKLGCRVILVGDTDQLPSVSAGDVLSDILESGQFPSIRLKKVFRQGKESLIVNNAHAIINGQSCDFSNKGKDFFIVHKQYPSDAVDTLVELCTSRLPNVYNFDVLTDIQVICPSKKLETGTVNLNNILQSFLNPPTKNAQQISYKGVYFRVGDKVMQIKNNYDLLWINDNGEEGSGIFNGDVGFITEIDLRTGNFKVKFDDKTVTYLTENIAELDLAYAITAHKSQGSEFDCVIIPLVDVPQMLKYRNLLYTAITRAKKLLVIVGSETVFNQMAQNDKKTLRYTLIRAFIDEKVS